MTLIEVIAGLVVLAVLISAVALARGRLLRQWETAQKKTQAARAVDRMLAGLGARWRDAGGMGSQCGAEAHGMWFELSRGDLASAAAIVGASTPAGFEVVGYGAIDGKSRVPNQRLVRVRYPIVGRVLV